VSPISPSSSALGHQRRDGVDDQHVDRAGAHQRVGDLERLLAGIGLAEISSSSTFDAELASRSSDRARARRRRRRQVPPDFWASAMHMQRQRGLARAFRPVDLDDAAARQIRRCPSAMSRPREPVEIASDLGDGGARAELHDRAFAEVRARSGSSAASNALFLSIDPSITRSGAAAAISGIPYSTSACPVQTEPMSIQCT
jgi:hypothetical protein